MPHLLLLLAAAHGGSFQDVLDAARADGTPVLPAGTGTLGGLAGDLACVAADDPEDCGATREPAPDRLPLLDFPPLEARLLPPLAGRGATLLLRRRPWGTGEPVIPFLGPPEDAPGGTTWVRIDAPNAVPGAEGPVSVRLVAVPLLPPADGPPIPPPLPFPPGGAALAWPAVVPGGLALRVGMPLGVRAVRAEAGDRVLVDAAFQAGHATVDAAPLLDGEAARDVAARLAPAAGACARAAGLLRSSLLPWRRPSTGSAEARLLVAWDGAGRVAGGVVLSPPWRSPELTTCLEANVGLLDTPSAAGRLGFLSLSLDAVPLE